LNNPGHAKLNFVGRLFMRIARLKTTVFFAVAFILYSSNLFAQSTERDWSKITWGGQDYYRAMALRPNIKPAPGSVYLDLLDNVEYNHLNKEVFRNFSTGQYEYVINNLKYTLGAFPNHPIALGLLGSVAKLTNNVALAGPFFEKALQLYPQYAMTHAQYGQYLVTFGLYDDGISKLKNALRIDPKLAIAYAWLAEAYSKTGKADLATEAALKARQLGYRDEIAGNKDEKPPAK
jgi:tetratricopeptide (TPR) repeat protein